MVNQPCAAKQQTALANERERLIDISKYIHESLMNLDQFLIRFGGGSCQEPCAPTKSETSGYVQDLSGTISELSTLANWAGRLVGKANEIL